MNEIMDLAIEGLHTDGAHHKQYYLMKILEQCVQDIKDDVEEGMPP